MTSQQPRISFFGAAGTVTGSRYLVELGGKRILVDCGLFQGYKPLRLRNWSDPPFDPRSLDGIVLTHAHIDHSGYLPRLCKLGFRGPVWCSKATAELSQILLVDSGHLQEADADYAKRHGFSRHDPPLPLYTEADARRSLAQLRPLAVGEDVDLDGELKIRLFPVGHILGACGVVLKGDGHSIGFSGDLGRPDDVVMCPPHDRPDVDWQVVESTYGDRVHGSSDILQCLAEALRPTLEAGGTVVVPAFAVGRTQALLTLVTRLVDEGRIPDVPIIVDSPMATSVTRLYATHRAWHRLDEAQCERAFDQVRYTRSPDESKALDQEGGAMVLISASGMATGGRVTHHLKRFAPFAENLILFAGYQAGGTRGANMVAGADSVKIHGDWVPIRAKVQAIDLLSSHADANQILAWLETGKHAPRHTFVTHGEPHAADAMRHRIKDALGWNVTVPEHRQRVELT